MKPERITEGDKIEVWRQHLLDAAAYIEEHGHYKGSCFDSYSGAVCAGGALIRVGVTDVFSFATPELKALERYVGMSISLWNDRPSTTKEMAVNALIGAALS